MKRLFASAFAALCIALYAHGQTPPLPYGSELMANGGFDSGANAGTLGGWTVTPGTATSVVCYGTTGVVGTAVATNIGGMFCYAKDSSGNARIRQTFNLAGNQADVAAGGVRVELSAYLGGVSADLDSAQVNVLFFLANGVQFTQATLPSITRDHRNSETVLMRREAVVAVPTAAASMAVEVAFNYVPGGAADGVVDNVSAVLTLNSPPPSPSPKPLDTELLSNPGFELGWSLASPLELNNVAGWFGNSPSSMLVESYGIATTPGLAVQAYVGGVARLLRDVGGNARLAQVIDVTGNAGAINAGQLSLVVGGYFGGISNDPDFAQLSVQCLDLNNVPLRTAIAGPVTNADRNLETVLMRRETTVAVPAGTRRLFVELQYSYFPGGPTNGLADNLSVRLTATQPAVPLPLNVDLLVNGDFASGWASNSPLTLNDPRGWRGGVAAAVEVGAYGLAPNFPSIAVGNYVGGGAQLVRDSGGNARLRQFIDLSANAPAVDASALSVRLSGWFGGLGADVDYAQLNVDFRNANGVSLGSASSGAVTRENRNGETVVMRRETVAPIPALTRLAIFELSFSYFPGGTANGLADSVSAMLVATPPVAPQPLSTELLVNGTFQSGWAPGSPLLLNDVRSWVGITTAATVAEAYGGAGVPNATATAIGGGTYYARDSGGGANLRQQLNLTGNATEIDLGALSLHLSGYFGGFDAEPDHSQAVATFLSASGATLGTVTLGPVTNIARGNVTSLLPQSTPTVGVPVPPGTRALRVDLIFTYFPGGPAFAVADNLSAMLTSSFSGPYQWPGTGEDLLFATGVNAPPTGGPGNDVKGATGGDTAFVLVDSPNGSFDYSPLIVAVNVRPTGTPLLGIGFGIQLNDLNPNAPFFILYDGAATPGAFGAPAVLPGGMNFTFFVPPGLAGTTVRLQAMAFPGLAVAAFMPAMPANGIFATTEAHEIVIL